MFPRYQKKMSFLFPKTRQIRFGYWWSNSMTLSCTRFFLVSPQLISGNLFMDWVVSLPFRTLDILRLVESFEPSKMSAGQASTLPPCCTALGIRAHSLQLTCRELSQAEQQDMKWEPGSATWGYRYTLGIHAQLYIKLSSGKIGRVSLVAELIYLKCYLFTEVAFTIDLINGRKMKI